jgi:F-type H+-transporting ATPase subunit alpha
MDDLPVADAKRFEEGFLQYMESRNPEIGRTIAETGALPEELIESLRAAVQDFKSTFVPSEGAELKEAAARSLSEEEQEALKRFRRPTPEEFEAKAGHAGGSGVQLPG